MSKTPALRPSLRTTLVIPPEIVYVSPISSGRLSSIARLTEHRAVVGGRARRA